MIIDTAGIRKRGKIYENIEKYSILRALSAIDRSNVALFLIDGEKGIRDQDKHVAGLAHEAGKGCHYCLQQVGYCRKRWKNDALKSNRRFVIEFVI